jgi:hypothetical protein
MIYESAVDREFSMTANVPTPANGTTDLSSMHSHFSRGKKFAFKRLRRFGCWRSEYPPP